MKHAAPLVRLQRQIAQHGTSVAGMPHLLVYEGSDGVFELVDGVTRATPIAKLLPRTTVRVEVLGKLRRPKAQGRRIGDALRQATGYRSPAPLPSGSRANSSSNAA
jgi:hypothetical protein